MSGRHNNGPVPYTRAGRLLRPRRKPVLSPEKTVSRLNLRPDSIVLEQALCSRRISGPLVHHNDRGSQYLHYVTPSGRPGQASSPRGALGVTHMTTQ